MTKKIWEASLKRKTNSNLYAFEKYLSKKFNRKFNRNYKHLLDWSIKNSSDFWSACWDFTKIKGTKSKKKIKKSKIFHKNLFLPGTKLNFGQNLLSKNTFDKALTFISCLNNKSKGPCLLFLLALRRRMEKHTSPKHRKRGFRTV